MHPLQISLAHDQFPFVHKTSSLKKKILRRGVT
jgi:hypothetical protein